jgi:Ca-activated chloride channel family protein
VLSSTPIKSSQSIKLLPSNYDFGYVTPNNSPEPLEAEIVNEGSGALSLNDIILSDIVNFSLDLSGGSNPCNTRTPAIAAGGNCTVEVVFQPGAGEDASFSAKLTILSNDPVVPESDMNLVGYREAISELNVKINQVEDCPRPGEVTAYVSVTDQGGYPVKELSMTDFEVLEGVNPKGQPTSAFFVTDGYPISVALVMDYSGSITDEEDNRLDMEESVGNFVDQLGENDEAEIIKFADDWDRVESWQPGTLVGKNLLNTAIYAPYNNGNETDLYDAVVQAVADAAARPSIRKAVIVISDGVNDGFLTNYALADVINDAKNKGVPIFTIGIGQQLNADILRPMAEDTGGIYNESATSDNLRTIYQQLAEVLFEYSYILTYDSLLQLGDTVVLTIKANLGTITGNGTKEIMPCQ